MSSSNARAVIRRMQARLKGKLKELPKILGNEGQKYFSSEFAKQQFDRDKWPEVKRKIPGTFAYKYPKNKGLSRRTSPALVGRTKRLKRAVATSFKSGNSKIIKWAIMGEVGKYGARHNYGLKGMPQRQFMGNGPGLRRRLLAKVQQVLRS